MLYFLLFLPGKNDTDAVGDAAHALRPHVLVDRCVNADISGPHSLLCKLLHGLDRSGCSLLEGTILRNNNNNKMKHILYFCDCICVLFVFLHMKKVLVEVDGVLTCNGLLGRLDHFLSGDSVCVFRV